MRIEDRNNIRVSEPSAAPQAGAATTMVFLHGFGCDQTMWCYLEPLFRPRYRTVLFDLVGSGASDLAAYDFDRYARLDAHGDDLRTIIHAVGGGPVICVGHSVSAMSALLASIAEPELFAAQVMLAPSPCYVDDAAAGYRGGFSRADIDDLLAAMDSNYLGWSARWRRPSWARPASRRWARTWQAAFAARTPPSPGISRKPRFCPTTAPSCRTTRRRP